MGAWCLKWVPCTQLANIQKLKDAYYVKQPPEFRPLVNLKLQNGENSLSASNQPKET